MTAPDRDPVTPVVPEWVLTEEVSLTLVECPGDGNAIFLVKRTGLRPGDAITLHFDEGRILVNGLFADLGDDPMAYSSMVDDAFPTGPTANDIGRTVRSEPYPEEDPDACPACGARPGEDHGCSLADRSAEHDVRRVSGGRRHP